MNKDFQAGRTEGKKDALAILNKREAELIAACEGLEKMEQETETPHIRQALHAAQTHILTQLEELQTIYKLVNG